METELPKTSSVCSARAAFPRGLFPPEGTFRFSADALLLAAFTVRRCLPETGPAALLDLGCGCGVISLACLLAAPELSGVGIDIDPDLAAAARANAGSLGLERRFAATVLDLASDEAAEQISPGGYDAVAANMPFRSPAAGRVPPSAARRRALFADESTMPVFLGGAKRALAEGGRLALIYPLDDPERLLEALAQAGFYPLTVQPVIAARPGSARVLVAAARGRERGAAALRLPPLSLYASAGGPYTEEALAFCPWLVSRPWSPPADAPAEEL